MSQSQHSQHGQDSARPSFSWRRLLPLALIVAALVAALLLGLDTYLTFETLRDHKAELMEAMEAEPVAFAAGFMLVYAVAVAISLPGGAILTIAGAFCFGQWLGTLYTVIAATAGATALFLIARGALGEPLRARIGPSMRRMEAGFRANAFSYLLVLRLIPLFPFFIVNLVPAFLGVGLRTYVIATVIGIIPGTFVFASVGAGLSEIFMSGESFSVDSVLTPQIITALVGLALLALAPVIYKKIRHGRIA